MNIFSFDSSSEERSNDASNNSAEDLSKILTRLGYQDLRELCHNAPTTIFDMETGMIKRQPSERTTSHQIEKQLDEWRKQKHQKQAETMEKIKQRKKSTDSGESKPNKNNAQKVLLMMGVENFENADDVTAICNASTKALRKLV